VSVLIKNITRRADCANKRRIYKFGIGKFAKVSVLIKNITRRADCANKRRIYKWIRKFAKVVVVVMGKILQDAPIAQIKGGFINWN